MPAVAPTVAPTALRQTCDRSSPRAAPSRRGIPSAAPPNLVSGLAVMKGACVAAVGRGWVRAGRSHNSLMARRHHRSKG
eukprot:COSAG01_NODE_7342_length_3242_cov_21.565383_1_plen_78_part_10